MSDKTKKAAGCGYIIVDTETDKTYLTTFATNRLKAWENFCGPIKGVHKVWQKHGMRCVRVFVTYEYQLPKGKRAK